jgi:16S rRNA (cytosine967-C5)-methyltransferase
MRRVEEGAFADRAFAAEARKSGVADRERQAAMRLSFGVVQRRRTLDWLIDRAVDRPERVEPRVRDVLRVGTFELVYSDRVPEHAAVDQAVRAARALPGSGARRSGRGGLVNAVLRRVAREGGQWLADCADPAVRHSMPDWIATRLARDLGDQAEAVMEAANRPAQTALRWNPLRGPRSTVERALPATARRGDIAPEAYVIDGPFDLEGSALWRQGRVMGQSQASMIPARVLAPQPLERVLDLCSAPGAKATQLAALSRNAADIVAVELHESRARAVRALARRLGARLSVIVGDATEVRLDGPFDAVLVDPPCTGTGVLSARPDARWRRREESLDPLRDLQERLLRRALELVRPGGRVVYSTCSLLAEENEQIVAASGAPLDDLRGDFPRLAHPALAGALQTRPDLHGTDGFFIARMSPGRAPVPR